MGFWQVDTAAVTGSMTLATNRTAMKAVDTSKHQSVFLYEGGRTGIFVFRSGDYSAFVTADTLEGIYVKADDTATSSGAWVRTYSGSASVKWFGAKGDNSAADLPSIQAATDLCDAVFIPNGTYKTSADWLLDDLAALHFESRGAVILSTSTTAIIKARGGTSYRNLDMEIHSGWIEGSGKDGPIGLDLTSASMVKVFGTRIGYCHEAVHQGGTGSQGAYYNEFHAVDCFSNGTAYENSTLANHSNVFGGRSVDCNYGSTDSDNTDNNYNGWACETFVNSAHRVSHDALAAQRIRFLSSRMENLDGTGTGIDIKSAAQATVVFAEFYATIATGVSDAGTGTDLVASY